MEEECRKINLEDKYKGALRKAKEVREYVYKRNNGCEPSIAECLAYDMQYVEQYVENLIARYKELEKIVKTYNAIPNDYMPNDVKMIIADREYFNNGILKENCIPKSKVKEKIDSKFKEAKGLYERGVQPQAKFTMKLLRDLEKELIED